MDKYKAIVDAVEALDPTLKVVVYFDADFGMSGQVFVHCKDTTRYASQTWSETGLAQKGFYLSDPPGIALCITEYWKRMRARHPESYAACKCHTTFKVGPAIIYNFPDVSRYNFDIEFKPTAQKKCTCGTQGNGICSSVTRNMYDFITGIEALGPYEVTIEHSSTKGTILSILDKSVNKSYDFDYWTYHGVSPEALVKAVKQLSSQKLNNGTYSLDALTGDIESGVKKCTCGTQGNGICSSWCDLVRTDAS